MASYVAVSSSQPHVLLVAVMLSCWLNVYTVQLVECDLQDIDCTAELDGVFVHAYMILFVLSNLLRP